MRFVTLKDQEEINRIAREMDRKKPYYSWSDLARKTGWSTSTVRRYYDENWEPGKYYQEPIKTKSIKEELAYPGLYMLGQRVLKDNKIINLIKVGQSTNIKKRLASYKGTNPYAELIDTREAYKEDLKELEKEYHFLLGIKNQRYNNTEWFVCTNEEYEYWTTRGFGLLRDYR